jgi:hypothetical protein
MGGMGDGGDVVPMRRALLLACTLLLSCHPLVNASTITLSAPQTVYQYGEIISVKATIPNDDGTPRRVYLEYYMQDQSGRLPTARMVRIIDLGSGESREITLYDTQVDERFYSGPYAVWASVIEDGVRLDEEELLFKVEGAPEPMNVVIVMSLDPDYTHIGRTFVKGEKIYLNQFGAPEDSMVSTRLTFPDNTTQILTLPSTILAKQVGLHMVKVNASCIGYRSISLKEWYAVLEKSPDILAQEKQESSITIRTDKQEYDDGEEVITSGEIIPSHAGAEVTLKYIGAGNIEIIQTAITDDDGHYIDVYKAPSEGEWSIQATWMGDSNHLEAQSQQVGFTVNAAPGTNLLPILIIAAIISVAVIIYLRKGKIPSF